MNLNVYAYCQGCGRGFADLEPVGAGGGAFTDTNLGIWLAGTGQSSGLPAFWPVVGALAALLFGATLLWARTSDSSMAGPLTGASAAVLAVAAIAWLAANSAGAKAAEAVPAGVRHVQAVLVEATDGARAAELERWLKRPRELRALRGVLHVDAPASSHGNGARTLIRLDVDGKDDPERGELERVIREHAGSGARVELFPPQEIPETRQPRVRMGVAAAVTLVGGLMVGGLALAATYAAMSGGTGTTEPTGPTGPTGFDGTVVARGNTFMTESITVPPATEVTLRVDNRDAGVLHNIAFFPGEATTGDYLEGCVAGCDKDGTAVRTAIAAGPVIQEFTFLTPSPGRYGYICEIHPTTMSGVLEAAEGAAPPA